MESPFPFTFGKRSLCLVAATLLSLFCFIGDAAAAEPQDEYSVKAAIILNFARFTQWPDPSRSTEPLALCILGEKSLAVAFREIDGKAVNGRTLHISFAEDPEDLTPCDILFLTRHFERMPLDDVFSSLGESPILTIGETPEFIKAGGMINIFKKNNHLRFEVNPETIRQHRLKLSSRLLKLAIIVGKR